MKNIIVTGATGFLGTYVIERLKKSGYVIISFSRKYIQDANSSYQVDLCDDDSVSSAFEEVRETYGSIDGVVHLAANVSVPGDEKTFSDNCQMTYHILKYAIEYGCHFFINISSIPVIGEPITLPVDEKHVVCPKTPYHMSKYLNELMVSDMAAENMRVVHLRISSPIGRGMNAKNFLSVLLERFLENRPVEIYGEGKRIQNYIDIRDVVSAIELAVKSNMSGIYLIAGNQSISNLDLANKCKEITNSSSEIRINKQKIDPEETNKWMISTAKAETELGFRAQYTLDETIKWILEDKI